MKKQLVALLLASVMMVSVTACGSTGTGTSSGTTVSSAEAESGTDAENNTVYGKVTKVDGNKVTVTVGTMEESDQGPSTFEEGSESKTYDLSDAEIQKESMGGPGGQTPPDGSSSGDGNSKDGQQPPEKPSDGSDGSSSEGQSTESSSESETSDSGTSSDKDQQPPEKPSDNSDSSVSGDSADGQGKPSGKAPEAQTEDAEVTDISEGDILKIVLNDDGSVKSAVITSQGGAGGNFGGSGEVEQGSAANTISEDSTVSSKTYTSTSDDENALRVDGATVTLDGIDVEKTGGSSSNTEDGDFYGMNAGLLATNGANVTIKNATVNTTAQNGNGVFSYGEGTTVNISDSKITTTNDNSGGIQTTGGGTTNASNLTVETSGNSSAAIRSDRGGGTVTVNGGTYTSNGYNSPAIYSTAKISASDATLTANNSEALVIEGQNSITLENSNVTGNMSSDKGTSSDTNVHNVMIYQSMSGDAEEGTADFSMMGGSLTGKNGDMFYVTNTDCNITLNGVTIDNQDSDGNLLTIKGNDASHGWGTAGENGGNVTLKCSNQTLNGNIVVDSISTLNMTLSDNSSFTGTINIVDNEENGTAVDNNAVVTVEKGSTWTLTGDCTITSLTNEGTINFNGHTITLADGTVLDGNS